MFAREGTNNIRGETRRKTINEIRQQNNKILINVTLMDYPTKADREIYNCSLYCLTYNCGSSKRALIYIYALVVILKTLEKATTGVVINMITWRNPTISLFGRRK